MKINLLKIIVGLVLACASAVAIAYLAGALFYLVNKTMPTHMQIDTWYRYWQAYQDDPVQSRRLLGSLAAATLTVCALPLGAMLKLTAQTRALHGDARWATEREIRKAGLL